MKSCGARRRSPRHARVPAGDLGSILDRALTLLIDDLERRRFARAVLTAAGPAARVHCVGDGAYRAAVQACRCGSAMRDAAGSSVARGGAARARSLEFHHVAPYAAGGAATADNIQLRCQRAQP